VSAYKETLIFCDGASGGVLANDFSCPEDGPYSASDARSRSAKSQRASYGADGWLYRNGKDYCPACAKKIFGSKLDNRVESQK
jgi:hypothetical protein